MIWIYIIGVLILIILIGEITKLILRYKLESIDGLDGIIKAVDDEYNIIGIL